MALKAGEGRYGLTRKMFLKLKNLVGISSDNVGNGLGISSNKLVVKDGKYLGFDENGKLDVLIGNGLKSDTNFHLSASLGDGLEFDQEGRIKCSSGGGLDYSLTKQDTGLKWLDGRSIYKQTFQGTCSAVDTDITITNCDFIINYEGFLHQKLKNSADEWNLPIPFVAMASGGGSINQNQCVSIDVYYHKFTIRTGSQRLADSDPLTYTVTCYFVETAQS